MKITIYSTSGKIIKSLIEDNNSESLNVTYTYHSDRIIKKTSGKDFIYILKNGRITKAKIGDSQLRFKYSNDYLTEIERTSGDEITKTTLIWDAGNVIEIHTDDNYLGNSTMQINYGKPSNTIGIIPSLLKSEFNHEIDFALMSAGYFGKYDEHFPDTISCRFGDNDTSDILQIRLSYIFDSRNRITIQSDQSKDDRFTIEFVRR